MRYLDITLLFAVVLQKCSGTKRIIHYRNEDSLETNQDILSLNSPSRDIVFENLPSELKLVIIIDAQRDPIKTTAERLKNLGTVCKEWFRFLIEEFRFEIEADISIY